MIFLDSGVIIALADKGDELHEAAYALVKSIVAGGESIFITSHVFDEILTYTRRKIGEREAEKAMEFLLNTKKLEIIMPELETFDSALGYFKDYKDFSFCDALSAALMKEYGIRKILSFDSDFDAVPGITRLQ